MMALSQTTNQVQLVRKMVPLTARPMAKELLRVQAVQAVQVVQTRIRTQAEVVRTKAVTTPEALLAEAVSTAVINENAPKGASLFFKNKSEK